MTYKHVYTKFLCIGIMLCISIPSYSQTTLWPGDVNDNGIVNTIDLLYCAIAKDSVGPAREEPSGEWEVQLAGEEWTQNFGEGTNFAYADCNGDGIADDDDFDVLNANYGNTHGTIIPDVYTLGDPNVDPILKMEAITSSVEPGGSAKIKLSLGDDAHLINDFFGIAFRLYFNPDLVADHAPGNNQSIKLKFAPNSWINGQGFNKAAIFMKVDNVAGYADFAILRKNVGSTSGSGEIGSFIVVMEDIILLEEQLNLSIDNIKMINQHWSEFPVAPSAVSIDIDDSNSRLIQESTEIAEGIVLYSQSKEKEVWVESDEGKTVNKIEVYNSNDVLLKTYRVPQNATKQKINLSKLNNGRYLLKIYSGKKVYTHLISI